MLLLALMGEVAPTEGSCVVSTWPRLTVVPVTLHVGCVIGAARPVRPSSKYEV